MSPALAGGFLTTAPPGKSLNIAFRCTGKPKKKKLCVTHFIAVVWNQIRDITKVCLSLGVELLGCVVIPFLIF